jgi:DNA polymerase-1
VLDIERAGYRVDQQLMRRYETELTIVSQRRRELAYTIAGKEFNLNSDAELVDVFKHLGVEWHWFTAKEEYQTDKRIMKYLTGDTNEKVAQLAQAVLDYRKAEKMLSTYITGLFQYIQEDGKVHCDFWISPDDFGRGGTSTGRMSSSNPNFQNIPKKSFKLDEFEFNIRNIFVADESYTLVFQDANAEEYRMLGHYGQDEKFMQFIREGKDIHKATAAMVFNIPYDDVTDEQRAVGKTTNFG